jgi:hypothetical protein
MPKNICITFSGAAYHETTQKIVENLPRYGADKVVVYDDVWLKTSAKEFCEKNRWAFDHPHKRGFGWYIWKPYIVKHAFDRAQDGDVIMYVDADTYPIKDLSVLFKTAQKEGLMIFSVAGANQREWCKRDCFITMGQDEEKYYDTQAAVARFMLFKKGSDLAEKILNEWLMYTTNKLCNTFDPSTLGPELPGFKEHRAEQAVLTNLAHKYGVKIYREADQSGERYSYNKDLYPTLFHQDGSVAARYKNSTVPELGSRFRNVE